ncbi:hypothetical protein [Dysgonomonas sp. ZJ279]|uniref:hypothetical protein n=1 Tax=Dysgonomonas sp. ZJ279 TaxID=2709796 RepID=UPI0013E9C452|nr:hypothetical protein [Dysgonomonas sp. ZJ279]
MEVNEFNRKINKQIGFKILNLSYYMLILCIAIIICNFELKNESLNYDNYLYLIISISILYPILTIIRRYAKYFFYYIFCFDGNWWRKEIERPRIFILILSIITLVLSYQTLIDNTIKIDNISAVYFFNSLIYILIFVFITLLYYINTQSFERDFIRIIKEKFLYDNTIDLKCTINEQDYDLVKILSDLKNIDCSISVFKDMTNLYKIDLSDRIKCNLTKAEILRYVHIFFDINQHMSPKTIKNLLKTYFVDQDGNDFIIQDKASEISNIKREIINKENIFMNTKNTLQSIFQNNKIQ